MTEMKKMESSALASHKLSSLWKREAGRDFCEKGTRID